MSGNFSGINHLDKYEKSLKKFIEKIQVSITEKANKPAIGTTKIKKEEIKSFARAQIEVLSYLVSELPKVKETVEYLR